jgi:hypothetical protein
MKSPPSFQPKPSLKSCFGHVTNMFGHVTIRLVMGITHNCGKTRSWGRNSVEGQRGGIFLHQSKTPILLSLGDS